MSHHRTKPSVEAEKISVQVLLGIQKTWIAGCLNERMEDKKKRDLFSLGQREVGHFISIVKKGRRIIFKRDFKGI